MTLSPKDISVAKLHAYMLSAVAPRPIALASTTDKEGNINLSPFSFFNAFGSNPATLVFSPSRRVRDSTTKHTLENVSEVPEVVINTVNYEMVHQVSLASVEFPRQVNEFVKSGLTPVPSVMVKPFRVKESPVQFECRVVEIKAMGNEGGAANLVICEVLLMHINDEVLDANGRIDQHKIDLVARLGENFYVRASGNALFEVAKPNLKPAIGIDQLPERIRQSNVLTGNNLGQLGNAEIFPDSNRWINEPLNERLGELFQRFENDPETLEYHRHLLAKELLDEGNVEAAWQVLFRPPVN